jgi:hypothetical protein
MAIQEVEDLLALDEPLFDPAGELAAKKLLAICYGNRSAVRMREGITMDIVGAYHDAMEAERYDPNFAKASVNLSKRRVHWGFNSFLQLFSSSSSMGAIGSNGSDVYSLSRLAHSQLGR